MKFLTKQMNLLTAENASFYFSPRLKAIQWTPLASVVYVSRIQRTRTTTRLGTNVR